MSVRPAGGVSFLSSVPGDPAGVEGLAGRVLPVGRWQPRAFRPVPAHSCAIAIGMAAVLLDEIRLRPHARPLDSDEADK